MEPANKQIKFDFPHLMNRQSIMHPFVDHLNHRAAHRNYKEGTKNFPHIIWAYTNVFFSFDVYPKPKLV